MTDSQNTKQIPLTQGKFAIVDSEDFKRLNQWKWYFNAGYALRGQRNFGCKGNCVKIYMHRLIAETPEGMQTDHINGDRLDNRKCNLRAATISQNIMNQKPQIGCSSKFKGVFWNNRINKWQCQIKSNKKYKYIGVFDSEDNAAKAYNNAAMELHGEFARLNIVEE